MDSENSASADHATFEDGPPACGLPQRMRLLCVCPREPAWTNLTLKLDAEGCLEPQFRWVSTPGEAMTVLRSESFDCVILCGEAGDGDADNEETFEALPLLDAIQSSGCDDPVVFVATHLGDTEWSEIAQRDCEILVSPGLWQSQALVPVIKRAVNRIELARENHRMAARHQRRLVRERDEAEHLLDQQRQIVRELEGLAGGQSEQPDAAADTPSSSESAAAHDGPASSTSRFRLPQELNDYYHELLRTYVIMGSGNLAQEIGRLAELLFHAGLSPREAMELHLERVETLVHGLGNRSARHVMARADLLALELMVHLGECYQQRADSAA